MLRIPAWLLLFLGALAPPGLGRASQDLEGGSGAQCFQSLSGEDGALNLGQRWGDSSPAATLLFDLSTVTSAASYFDFRTFDPEGVIFYGDTLSGINWFVLALRNGKPEIQIENFIINITVSAGLRLNDGQWHRVMVKNDGHRVILEVDGDDQLTLSHVSANILDESYTSMRIGVGGFFIPKGEMIIPLNPALDACIRHWNWLNQSTEWLEGASLKDKGVKGCFPTISRGSFFPGDGLASFSLSGLPVALRPGGQSWSLSVEMRVGSARQAASLLVVSSAEQTLLLHLDVQLTDLVAKVGNNTAVLVPLPVGSCWDLHIHLRVTQSDLKLRLGNTETSQPILKEDFEALKDAWLSKKGHLVVGGLPGPKPSLVAQERRYFRGCLRELWVQGAKLDFDSVQYRSNSIWAHSCPGEDRSKSSASREN